MRIEQGTIRFSATDLVNFLGCRHATYLDAKDLAQPAISEPTDPFVDLLQAKGVEHELRYLARLKAAGHAVVDLTGNGSTLDRANETREAMAAGAEVIYQGALRGDRWQGYADFLIRVPGKSALGDFHYEPVDTKLSGVAKPKHALQLAVYAGLLTTEQNRMPAAMHIVVGDGSVVSVPTADLHYYANAARARLEAFANALPEESAGEPCSHCAQCRWSDRCEQEWQQTDHLSLVAGITRGQRAKLVDVGITTMTELAAADTGLKVAGIQTGVLARIRDQARLQVDKRTDGKDRFELLEPVAGKGFARLPRPNAGDLYFDMEGDPLFPEGLEYLFGFVRVENGKPTFTPFWGHSRAEEKIAFECAVDLIHAQLRKHPGAHIYHYAPYEESALKRLAMLHGTREAEVDHLLRNGKLVDLYQVVREAIRVSEPSYSIKNLERFYMKAREGEVKDAGASVVVYEQWRLLLDPALLQQIASYNEWDCVSTWKLREWLLTLRPAAIQWYTGGPDEEVDPGKEAKRQEAERRSIAMQEALMKAPAAEQPYRELVGQLLEFHRREAKPAWWAMFARGEMTEEDLIEDAECIGGLRRDPDHPPYPVKKSIVTTFLFPPQDFKMRVGDRPKRADTLKDAGEIVLLDEEAGRVSLKIGPTGEPYQDAFSLIAPGPIDASVIRDAIYRYADAVVAGNTDYSSVRAVLLREPPRIKGRPIDQPIISEVIDLLPGASSAIGALDDSYMLVQGPPGTGKTYLSAHVIVDLLTQGKRIGVTSNSHKAISNLLLEVESQAIERGVAFRGVKKSSGEDQELNGQIIEDVSSNDSVIDGHYDLIAGTAWMFSRPEFDQILDYLFIDEAGQVSLANVVAMGLSARNIVLVGDQMQLAQPLQGVHPGHSGTSVLEFLLGDKATVPPERGIFLAETRRMHPAVCRFISEAVYEGRLQAREENAVQSLVLSEGAHSVLRPFGVSFVPVNHQNCSQRNEEEAECIRALYADLLGQRWVSKAAAETPIGPTDILVVTPYNMQVNLLTSVLPDGARVGTVDKFQGQEAAVVLVSMTSSSAEDVSRGLDFLYSRNRLNVAISRAKCLAVVVASPRLLEATCNTIELLKLVNTLCFVEAYSQGKAFEIA